MHPGIRLRALLARPEIVVLPGVYDALSARLAQSHGFEALVAGGNAATGVLLGEPDLGQLSMRDYVDHYARIAAATTLPLLVDADTGFGGVHNVQQMVRFFERAGVAGLFMEDQATPKRCGYLAGKAVIPVGEMIGKIHAALDARRDPALIICARTDALGIHGRDEAIERAQRYREAGADMTFVQGADRMEDLRAICEAVPGPQLANVSQAAQIGAQPVAEIERAGAAALMYSITTMLAAARAVDGVLGALRRDGHLGAVGSQLMPIQQYNEIVGLAAKEEAEARYAAHSS
ncbi:isocitrate lyase/PEP mutase family protein [Paraburkholderia sp. ZP32-5]|uniref:isocitrate lyase/PEP mutase family protein n=1 Tax=Paraburkholderia sp. ZP32-5 TaxID=2883245 RepID=UPI001F45023F|nr:oxaloacetate decarboxylase [Paraburkholderia sp. ZP32-5]